MEIISTLVTGVVAAVISGIVSVLISYKNNNLEYVTQDRKTWRDEIRSIVEGLSNADVESVQFELNRIKVRINAYGRGEQEQYMQDSHIWELIEDIENNVKLKPKKQRNKLFECQKKWLIEYLSLLLKFDWERSKKEVGGQRLRGLSIVVYIIGSIVLGIVFWGNMAKNLETCISVIVILIIIEIGYYVLLKGNLLQKKMEQVCVACAIFLSVVTFICIIVIRETLSEIEGVVVGIACVCLLCANIMSMTQYLLGSFSNYEYISKVKIIREAYKADISSVSDNIQEQSCAYIRMMRQYIKEGENLEEALDRIVDE